VALALLVVVVVVVVVVPLLRLLVLPLVLVPVLVLGRACSIARSTDSRSLSSSWPVVSLSSNRWYRAFTGAALARRPAPAATVNSMKRPNILA
jgi:hypothetical protein